MCLYWKNWKVDSCFEIPFLIWGSSLFLILCSHGWYRRNLHVFLVALCYAGCILLFCIVGKAVIWWMLFFPSLMCKIYVQFCTECCKNIGELILPTTHITFLKTTHPNLSNQTQNAGYPVTRVVFKNDGGEKIESNFLIQIIWI
jgi:hypothetical protein